MTETIADAIRAAARQHTEIAALAHRLTPRERTLLRLVAHGKTNKAIARELNITPGTVGVGVSRLLGKLDARDRANAVHIGWQIGILT